MPIKYNSLLRMCHGMSIGIASHGVSHAQDLSFFVKTGNVMLRFEPMKTRCWPENMAQDESQLMNHESQYVSFILTQLTYTTVNSDD